MSTDHDDRFFRLKLYQFIGGLVSVIAGAILVALDVNDVARVSLGGSGIEVGISAISGVAVILVGLFLFFRSGGGIRKSTAVKRKKGFREERLELSVDALRDYWESETNSGLVCPECHHEVDRGDIHLSCLCSSCKKEWTQRLPS